MSTPIELFYKIGRLDSGIYVSVIKKPTKSKYFNGKWIDFSSKYKKVAFRKMCKELLKP